MILTNLESRRRRKAITGVLATMIMLAMLFTVGLGFFITINQDANANNQANATSQAAMRQVSLERLALGVKLSTVPDPWGQTGDLYLTVNNTGGVTTTILDVFVTNVATGQLASRSQLSAGTDYYLNAEGTMAQKGDLNITLPLTINMGASTKTMTGCVAGKTGCTIAISQTSYLYNQVTKPTVLVSVLTSAGNVFSLQYPQPLTSVTTTATISTTSFTTTTISSGGVGGNALVVKMVATPPQTLSCTGCVTDTVTVYNYATSPVSSVALSPSPPAWQVTDTATLSGASCTGPSPSSTIAAYSGSGNAAYVTFTCTYSAQTGQVGGFASFIGAATGTLNGNAVSSSQEVSNTIQIGASISVLNQGPFTANSFFFKDSYCYQATGTYYNPQLGCTQTPSTLTLANLPNADSQDGSTDYYDAYYVQITNNFNTTLALLQNSYFQTDPTNGGESDFFLVGAASTYTSQGYYFPTYSSTPTLVPYGGSTGVCAESAPNYNPPSSANCIDIAPGKTVTLTFAACAIGSSYWDWGSSQYGASFDNQLECFPQNPPAYVTPESTYLSIILSFMYKGQVLAQQIPFQGETILGSLNNGVTACSEGRFCGTVYYTQYTGAVGYFDFTYIPAAQTLTIAPPVLIASGLPHGADGIQFDPVDHHLILGANDGQTYINEVNPSTGAVTTYLSTVQSYNVAVNTDGTEVWSDGDGIVGLASSPLTATGPGPATTLPLTGDDSFVNTLMFAPGSSTLAYYTADYTRFSGTDGHVGIINLQTGVTTCFKTAGSCTVFYGDHGGVWDPYSGDLIIFGADEVNQITTTGVLVAHETLSACCSASTFDQGAVDGYGHIFISYNGGLMYFEDYSGTGVIGTTNFSYTSSGGGAFANMDDVAPIIGPGSAG